MARNKTWSLLAPVLFALVALVPGKAVLAADCARGVQPITSPKALAYQDRGDRCEGLYIRPIATTGLSIVGFHSAPNHFLANENFVEVQTPAAGESKRLIVVSTRPRQYYRMDADFQDSSFLYPLDLIRHPALAIHPEELAAKVCLENCDTLVPTLIPASLSKVKRNETNSYIILQATEDLTYMKVTATDRETGEVLLSKESSDNFSWPAWRALRVPLANLPKKSDEVSFTVIARGKFQDEIDSVTATLLD